MMPSPKSSGKPGLQTTPLSVRGGGASRDREQRPRRFQDDKADAPIDDRDPCQQAGAEKVQDVKEAVVAIEPPDLQADVTSENHGRADEGDDLVEHEMQRNGYARGLAEKPGSGSNRRERADRNLNRQMEEKASLFCSAAGEPCAGFVAASR